MGKLLIYYLNKVLLLIIFTLISCNNNKIDIKKSEFYFNKALKLDEIRQGSEYQQILFDSSLYYNPNNADAWFEKSTWEIKKGDYEKYFNYMNKAVELDPDIYIGWRGVIKMNFLHDFDGALDDFYQFRNMHHDSIELAAKGEDLDFLIGKTYWQKKEYKKAINFFNKSIHRTSEDLVDAYTFIYLGVCHNMLNQNEKAIISLNKALKYYPNSGDTYYYLAKIHLKNENTSKAFIYINKAIKYAEQGYLNKDSYKDVFGQLYLSDLYKLKEKIIKNKNS
ncbi:hypothetical protein UJ101_02040 [Flavobacteriaceae bacterium UJ101]|nr:hypothetical protein UJ101_02040 [Flavobacteriaceae bacterium UJ101]